MSLFEPIFGKSEANGGGITILAQWKKLKF